jgi:hypothetical protein
MAIRHPGLRPALPFAASQVDPSLAGRAVRFLAVRLPSVGDAVAGYLQLFLPISERLRLRRHWRRLKGILHEYWYWRGLTEATGGPGAMAELVRDAVAGGDDGGPRAEIDLREGLERAERRLDEERPPGMRIRYGPHVVGIVPPQPGAERLRGAHLRPILATRFALRFLEALAAEGSITPSRPGQAGRLARAIASLAPWYGPMTPAKMWLEQYWQWNRLDGQSEVRAVASGREERLRQLKYETAWLHDEYQEWRSRAQGRERMRS